ncbi:MAG: D-amino-acid transaminase [Geminicoccaceae bacterium]
MARIAYVNGRYLPIGRPAVALEDRGYQFADGVYEVAKVVFGQPRDLERHLDRLERSLGELRIAMPMSRAALRQVVAETLRRNAIRHAIVYIQVTRGTAPRNHLFPKNAVPSLVVTVRRAPFPKPAEIEDGVDVITLPDQRWKRCDIKSIGLLPNVLAKQKAAEQGAREAWLVDADGFVTEGSSANAYIIDQSGTIITRPLGGEILGGITRQNVFAAAKAAGVPIVERAFTVAEAQAAREAFLTSTSSLVLPVTRIDGKSIGNGKPGSITCQLLDTYLQAQGLADVV